MAINMSRLKAAGKYLPYVSSGADFMNAFDEDANQEAAIGSGIGTAAGAFFGGPLGASIGGFLGGKVGGMFTNEDPDKDLWGEPVQRLTGNNPDGWGSGGDWEQWMVENFKVPVDIARPIAQQIRSKSLPPDRAIQQLVDKGYRNSGIEAKTRGLRSPRSSGGHGGMGESRVDSELPTTAEMFGEKGTAYVPDIEIPEFQKSERFDPIQDELEGIATDILKGTPPEYYAPIGEYGGELFENVISSITSDVTKAAQSSDIARNMGRGGVGSVPGQVAKTVAPLRYEDYARAIQGRERLLGYGTDVLTNVRGADMTMADMENQFGLQTTGMKSEFDLNKARLTSGYELGKYGAETGYDAALKELALREEQINNQYELGLISADQKAEQLRINRDTLNADIESQKGDVGGDLFDIGITELKKYFTTNNSVGQDDFSLDIPDLFSNYSVGQDDFSLDIPDLFSNYIVPQRGKPKLKYPKQLI